MEQLEIKQAAREVLSEIHDFASSPYPVNTDLTNVVTAYKNEEFVADKILPRIPVGTDTFEYFFHDKEDKFTMPDNTAGRKGQLNYVETSGTSQTAKTIDYGLQVFISAKDIANASKIPNYNIRSINAELIAEQNALIREYRVAAAVQNADNYATANKTTLTASNQWSHADSDPLYAILTAQDACLMRPNKLLLNQAVATRLRTHPKVVSAITGNTNGYGVVSLEQIRQVLELDEIIVAAAWYQSANPGQTATMARMWADSAVLFYQKRGVMTPASTTFGYTAQFGQKVAFEKQVNPGDGGLRGGITIVSGESVKEIICANDLGYLFVDCLA